MRLLVVTQYFWPEAFRINELVSELGRRGHKVTVLTGKPNYPDGEVFAEYRRSPGDFASYEGANVVRVPMVARGRSGLRLLLNYVSFAMSASLFGAVRLRREKFDAIFVFEPSPITVGIPAIILRRLRSWPVALWVLDQWPETLAAVGVVKSRVGLRMVGGLVSFIYARCDLILAQAQGMIPQIRKYCDPDSRVVYFPNWAESTYLEEKVLSAPEVPDWPDGFTIMFAGNIGDSQDLPAVLSAAEDLLLEKRIRWVIVGDGRAGEWVRAEVQRRGLTNVTLLGRYPPDRMPSFYRHADALLVSLRDEPIFSITVPGKIQSYLAFGRPILGMLNGEGARVIQESQAGFVSPAGDWKSLAVNVRTMAALSVAERSSMGASGSSYARREYDRDTLIGGLEAMLAEITPSKIHTT